MIDLILEDAAARPPLFHWFGKIDRLALESWRTSRHIEIPRDLVSLWELTGGGDLFETETILSPFIEAASENVDSVSDIHWRRGLDPAALVFHTGSHLSIFNGTTGSKFLVVDEETYRELASFDDLDSWYESTLRSEYGDRYGLTNLAALRSR